MKSALRVVGASTVVATAVAGRDAVAKPAFTVASFMQGPDAGTIAKVIIGQSKQCFGQYSQDEEGYNGCAEKFCERECGIKARDCQGLCFKHAAPLFSRFQAADQAGEQVGDTASPQRRETRAAIEGEVQDAAKEQEAAMGEMQEAQAKMRRLNEKIERRAEEDLKKGDGSKGREELAKVKQLESFANQIDEHLSNVAQFKNMAFKAGGGAHHEEAVPDMSKGLPPMEPLAPLGFLQLRSVSDSASNTAAQAAMSRAAVHRAARRFKMQHGQDAARHLASEMEAEERVNAWAGRHNAPEDELAKEMTHDLEMNFNTIAPFGKEDTAKELQDHAAKTQDTLVDAVENAEVAEIKRAVFRALTRLRAATIKEFDTIARLETQAIDAYNDAHHYRAENPLAHLHEDEAPVETDKLKSFH
jgi:hypothetical protein